MNSLMNVNVHVAIVVIPCHRNFELVNATAHARTGMPVEFPKHLKNITSGTFRRSDEQIWFPEYL